MRKKKWRLVDADIWTRSLGVALEEGTRPTPSGRVPPVSPVRPPLHSADAERAGAGCLSGGREGPCARSPVGCRGRAPAIRPR